MTEENQQVLEKYGFEVCENNLYVLYVNNPRLIGLRLEITYIEDSNPDAFILMVCTDKNIIFRGENEYPWGSIETDIVKLITQYAM